MKPTLELHTEPQQEPIVKSLKATMVSGAATIRPELESIATFRIEGKGIHHTELKALIEAAPKMLEALEIAIERLSEIERFFKIKSGSTIEILEEAKPAPIL